MRSELTAATAQIPDASQLGWRSSAERLFETRLDELSGLLKDAIAALDLADQDLSAQLVRVQNDQNQQNEREAMHRQNEPAEASARVR